MGIALVCDVPGCGEVIPPDEMDEILERYGEDKPPAIEVSIDGERYMLIEDACRRHCNEFKHMVNTFLNVRPEKVADKAPAKPERPAEEPRKPSRKRKTVIPGPSDGGVSRIGTSAPASGIVLKPSEVVLSRDIDVPAHEPANAVIAPQEASQALSEASAPVSPSKPAAAGPKPLKLSSQRSGRSVDPAPSKGPVAAVLEDEGVEEIIEPSYAGIIDFSDTRPA